MFMLCCRFEQLDTVERQCGGESVSQLPLKDKAFLTFFGQNPPFELRSEKGIFGSAKACSAGGPSSTTTPPATSERQIAVAPLSLIALQSFRGMPLKKASV